MWKYAIYKTKFTSFNSYQRSKSQIYTPPYLPDHENLCMSATGKGICYDMVIINRIVVVAFIRACVSDYRYICEYIYGK